MRTLLLAALCVAFVCMMASNAEAIKNQNVKYALHDAGPHNAKTNTCSFTMTDCLTEMNIVGGGGGAREDIYVLALDADGIAGIRYGICCEGSFYFYGWTKCCDLEIPTGSWPGCGEGNAQTWAVEEPGPNVTAGILDVYVYGPSTMSVCVDPREGFAEVCDGTQPSPICFKFTSSAHFGSVGFGGMEGFNPCNIIPVDQTSWGAVKSIYR